MFPPKAVTQVKQIQRMIATGFTIDDLERRRTRLIKTLLEGAVPPVD
jgi:MerR family transcriptional regulator, copper efflux regulator